MEEDDLGLHFLINNKKKGPGSDVFSISSSGRPAAGAATTFVDVKQHIDEQEDDGEDEEESYDQGSYSYEEDEEEDSARGGAAREMPQQPPQQQQYQQQSRYVNEEEVLCAKKELLYQFERLERKGMKLPKKFTIASSLEEMRFEFERLKRDKEVDASIKMQRRGMMAVVSGIEFLSNKFDFIGAHLDGWSDKVYDDIDDYDDIFEELHDKWKGKAKWSPELRLLMSLGGSALLFHMTNKFSSSIPGLDQVLKKNPELTRQLAAATADHMNSQKSTAGNFFNGIFDMFNGGGRSEPQMSRPAPAPASVPVPPMKGPSNVDDILKELESTMAANNNDRIEMLSTITESELDIDDAASSVNGVLLKKKKGRRVLDL